MSRAAQEIARQVREMQQDQRKTAKESRSVAGDPAQPPESVGASTNGAESSEQRRPQNESEQEQRREEQVMAKTIRKKTTKGATATKGPRAVKVAKKGASLTGPLHAADVRSEDRNRYVTIEFTNGAIVRLFPVNLDAEETLATRDALVRWLSKTVVGQ